ncbi:glycine-rich cell wall structural protein 1.8 [Oryza brachyantha]|uniref:glycine-rich cell wall structural protein 1.8 n=1 Tax=Oryza brachyantha TaxID=4533 RepID=UPI001ADCC363|nr:glycine-rich cell wall structural protein 1.8 [Oryza brachyantha]
MGDAGGGGGMAAAHWAALYGGGGGGANGGAAAGEGSGLTVSSPTSGGSGGSPTRAAAAAAQQGPGVEAGRVGKPARRRSRASRRAPVTLLNTDTSNFRAMVQQFTGIPSGPYGPAAAGGAGPVISFAGGGGGDYGGGVMPVRPSPTPASVMSFDHRLGHQHHRHASTPAAAASLQSQLFRPHHHHPYGGGDVGYGGGGGAMPGDMFLHGFESSPEDRLLLQSIQAAQMLPRPASANNTNGYNFG